jgi:hydrogenase nickel incorporation protein HypA/HybF
MHELGVTRKILAIVLTRARENDVRSVLAVRLTVGELSDLEDTWLQRYFDHLSRGTLAEGAELRITRVPVCLRCDRCAQAFQIDIHRQHTLSCPECGSEDLEMVSGDEYTIEDMEVL